MEEKPIWKSAYSEPNMEVSLAELCVNIKCPCGEHVFVDATEEPRQRCKCGRTYCATYDVQVQEAPCNS